MWAGMHHTPGESNLMQNIIYAHFRGSNIQTQHVNCKIIKMFARPVFYCVTREGRNRRSQRGGGGGTVFQHSAAVFAVDKNM
jgi:hypothetical protein